MHLLKKYLSKIVSALLVVNLIFTQGCGTKSLKISSKNLKLVDEKATSNMIKHGTGLILFVQDDEASQQAIKEVEKLLDEVQVEALVSEEKVDHIISVPSLVIVEEGKIVKTIDDFTDLSQEKEEFEHIKELRKKIDDQGCGKHCQVNVDQKPTE